MSVNDYISKIKVVVENLFTTRQLISYEDQIKYILERIGQEYDPKVINLTSRCDEVTLQEV